MKKVYIYQVHHHDRCGKWDFVETPIPFTSRKKCEEYLKRMIKEHEEESGVKCEDYSFGNDKNKLSYRGKWQTEWIIFTMYITELK